MRGRFAASPHESQRATLRRLRLPVRARIERDCARRCEPRVRQRHRASPPIRVEGDRVGAGERRERGDHAAWQARLFRGDRGGRPRAQSPGGPAHAIQRRLGRQDVRRRVDPPARGGRQGRSRRARRQLHPGIHHGGPALSRDHGTHAPQSFGGSARRHRLRRFRTRHHHACRAAGGACAQHVATRSGRDVAVFERRLHARGDCR